MVSLVDLLAAGGRGGTEWKGRAGEGRRAYACRGGGGACVCRGGGGVGHGVCVLGGKDVGVGRVERM